MSGMMFALVPARSAPTVSTAVSVPATSRETTVCRRITVDAAMTTGSTVASGREPCPPAPVRVTRRLSVVANAGPDRRPMNPAGIGATCWPSTTSGRGTLAKSPSATIAAAPPATSSAGWNSTMRVPAHDGSPASRDAAPSRQVTCMS